MITKDDIQAVYAALRDRKINPTGSFDGAGRWYAAHADLIDVRSPSRAWPYSQLKACRTRRYVAAVAAKFSPATRAELKSLV